MGVTSCKVLVLFLLAALKLMAGLAPLYITARLRKVNKRVMDKAIGLVLCVGGGVLMSTVFVHILPEVRESMERASLLGVHTDHYPFAELFLCSGFLMIFLVEALVQKSCGQGHGHGFAPHDAKPELVELDIKEDDACIKDGVRNSTFSKERVNNNEIRIRSEHKLICSTPKPMSSTPKLPLNQGLKAQPVSSTPKLPMNQGLKTQLTKLQDSCNDTSASFNDSSASIIASMKPVKFKQIIANIAREKMVLSSLRSFLVVVALSIHSVFEGMALGLQETEAGVWKLFLAVAIHATAILFCIGMEMVANGTKKVEIVTYMSILSVVTPVGVIIGILVTEIVEEASGTNVLVMGLLQGLAGGTLLYITFFEVFDRDKLNKYGMTGLLGVMAIVMGFAIMASMEGLGGHSHGGGGLHKHSHGGVDDHSNHHAQVNHGKIYNHEIKNHYGHGEDNNRGEHGHEEVVNDQNDKDYHEYVVGEDDHGPNYKQLGHRYIHRKEHYHGNVHKHKEDSNDNNRHKDGTENNPNDGNNNDDLNYYDEDSERNGTHLGSKILSILSNKTSK